MGKVLLVACTNVGKSIAREILYNNAIKSELCGIINLNARRGASKANYQNYEDICTECSVPLHYCDNINDEITLAWIRDKNPDIIIQSGWSQKFKEELLSIPKYGCIGEHPAPLPKGRGAACVNWAILTGETEWGDSFFQMVSEYDKGAILSQKTFRIEEYDDVKTVYDKVAAAAVEIIKEHINDWTEGMLNGHPQTDVGGTYYKKRTPSDGIFTLKKNAKELHDFIRAQTYPYPGAFVNVGGRKLRVLTSEIVHGATSQELCGTIVKVGSGRINVVCGKGGVICFGRVQYDNEPECWAEDFVNKHKLNKLR